MANFVYITLDTTAPSNPSVKIEGNAIFTTAQLAALTVGTSDSITTNYQMKIWGDVDAVHDANIKGTEVTSSWIPYTNNPQVKLSAGDGTKTINVKIRDDVHNASSVASDSIKLDTKMPTVTTTNTDVVKVSENPGKETYSFSFSTDKDIQEFKVKLVGTENATHDTGTLFPTTNGSTNTSGTGTITEGQVTTVAIKTKDLQAAGATSDIRYITKVFVKDLLGNWSA